MTTSKILNRARADILGMKAYASARSLATGADDTIYLDANELPCEPIIGMEGLSRYMPQQPPQMLAALSRYFGVDAANLLVTRGADEAIDVLTRLFCTPGADSIVICPPAFPMYEASAQLNGTTVLKAPLDGKFEIDTKAVLGAVREDTKIVYLCSPNNPTANLSPQSTIVALCEQLAGKAVVVADEAYIEFTNSPSAASLLARFDNLIVLRTLSKAMAMAGVRCGVLMAQPDIIAECKKVLAPYPVPAPVVQTVVKALDPENIKRMATIRAQVLQTKDWFIQQLGSLPDVETVYPSDTNFMVVKFKDAQSVYDRCKQAGIILRNQSHQPGLQNCIRISVGTRDEMQDLLSVLETGARKEKPQGRIASILRKTKETAIDVRVNLDATDPIFIATGIGFYDHMLEQIARHGGFALNLQAVGDTHIDAHHTVEDCAIALGQALKQALGNKAGIGRYGFTLPMDESQATVVLDLSGRSFFKFDGAFPERMIGELPTDMVEHIFRSIAENLNATIHLSVNGENTHHMVEACFKALGRALRQAVTVNGSALPSSKGVL